MVEHIQGFQTNNIPTIYHVYNLQKREYKKAVRSRQGQKLLRATKASTLWRVVIIRVSKVDGK